MLMQFLLDDALPTFVRTFVRCWLADRLTNSCSYIHCLRSGFSFVAEAADNDNEAGIDGLDDANSYGGGNGGAYADPRCEMKKRQQQEIVVSGLTINTSDISSGEEEEGEAKAEKDKRNLTDACSSFLVADEMSLIEETSVRKVGGGGALSTSIFQVFYSNKAI